MTALDIAFVIVGLLGLVLPLAVAAFLFRLVRDQEREQARLARAAAASSAVSGPPARGLHLPPGRVEVVVALLT